MLHKDVADLACDNVRLAAATHGREQVGQEHSAVEVADRLLQGQQRLRQRSVLLGQARTRTRAKDGRTMLLKTALRSAEGKTVSLRPPLALLDTGTLALST